MWLSVIKKEKLNIRFFWWFFSTQKFGGEFGYRIPFDAI